MRIFFFTLSILYLATMPLQANEANIATPRGSIRVIKSFPHDDQAFTQGLAWDDGKLYESTGIHGSSTLRRIDPDTGTVIKQRPLPPDIFGEGLTIVDEKIYQLSLSSRIGFVYDKHTFEWLTVFMYTTPGWGLTYDGEHLIMSDGTDTLHYITLQGFVPVKHISITDSNGPVTNINELEYSNGLLYANIWKTSLIAQIDPASGEVLTYFDFAPIATHHKNEGVLNGIAYDAVNNRIFITGKNWSHLYEVEFILPDNK